MPLSPRTSYKSTRRSTHHKSRNSFRRSLSARKHNRGKRQVTAVRAKYSGNITVIKYLILKLNRDQIREFIVGLKGEEERLDLAYAYSSPQALLADLKLNTRSQADLNMFYEVARAL
jgi:hypothetical protein